MPNGLPKSDPKGQDSTSMEIAPASSVLDSEYWNIKTELPLEEFFNRNIPTKKTPEQQAKFDAWKDQEFQDALEAIEKYRNPK